MWYTLLHCHQLTCQEMRFLGISLDSQMLDIPFSRLRGPGVHYNGPINKPLLGRLSPTEILEGIWKVEDRYFREASRVTP